MIESSEYYASARKLVENAKVFSSPAVYEVAKRYQEMAAQTWVVEQYTLSTPPY